jgi:hypothetical protein
MDDLDKLKLTKEENREYSKAHYWRKKNGEGPRPPGKPANTAEVLWTKVDKER